MTSVSIILPTARDDYPIIGLPNIHLFQPTIDSLRLQTFKDFELIVVDSLYHLRPKLFDGLYFGNVPFPIKHISVEHNRKYNHRFWLDNRRWAVAATLNTGLIHANGSLIVRLDDCCRFDSRYIERIWNEYSRNGLWLQTLYVRYLGSNPARLDNSYRKIGYETAIKSQLLGENEEQRKKRDEVLRSIYGEGGVIRDTRYKHIIGRMIGKVIPENWMYGYVSFPLETALEINGYDERFDGDKSLEDTDFGSRLEMKGYRKNWLLDVSHQVIEYEHIGVSEKVIDSGVKPIKCNWALYKLNRKREWYRANSNLLSKDDIKYVIKKSLKDPCSPGDIDKFYDENCKGKWFKMWLQNQLQFDLREERKLYGL